MKNSKWFLLILIIGLCSWQLVKAPESTVTPAHRSQSARPAAAMRAPASTTATDAIVPATPLLARVPAAATDSVELRSLNEMVETVANSTQTEKAQNLSLKGLVEKLQKSGQSPRIIRDANPDSGEMIIVRADAPLEGTRYFHAQYFVGDDGEPFVQHMSFEFKPGPSAMNDALAAVSKNFPGLSQPTHQREGYARWKLDENHILWVKSLTAEDVAHDPFNAYSQKDLGAVRVAVESEIHH